MVEEKINIPPGIINDLKKPTVIQITGLVIK